ncbi:hypothetical protein C8J57DRAFT_1610589 [Mycena rebaudengoi]|nr:hypothetical protein C8J57DRAFT_1610589 [Mycena rebaudengoi]
MQHCATLIEPLYSTEGVIKIMQANYDVQIVKDHILISRRSSRPFLLLFPACDCLTLVQITNVSGYDPVFFDEDDFASTTESAARSYSATFSRSSRSHTAGLIPLTPVPSLPGGFDPTTDFIIISISLPTVSLTDTCCSCRASAARASRALMRKGQLVRTGEKLRFQVGVCGQCKPAPVETVRTYALDAADEVRNTEYDVSAAPRRGCGGDRRCRGGCTTAIGGCRIVGDGGD